MCWICETANELDSKEAPVKWYHYFNRLAGILAALAGLAWILS